MAGQAGRVWGEGAKLGNQAEERSQFFHVPWLLEVAKGGELIVVGADAAVRDDVSCKVDAVAQFELFSSSSPQVVLLCSPR